GAGVDTDVLRWQEAGQLQQPRQLEERVVGEPVLHEAGPGVEVAQERLAIQDEERPSGVGGRRGGPRIGGKSSGHRDLRRWGGAKADYRRFSTLAHLRGKGNSARKIVRASHA